MRFKLTSPGVLLILAVLGGAGIFLLDVFYLKQHFNSHRLGTINDLAAGTERSAREALRDNHKLLLQACTAWAENPGLKRFLQVASPSTKAGFDAFAEKAFGSVAAERVWLCDPSGRIVQAWARPAASLAGIRERSQPEVQSAAEQLVRQAEANSATGLIQLPDGPAIFARQPIRPEANPRKILGHLLLVRYLNCGVLEHIGAATGAEVVLVGAQQLPETAPWWLTGDDTIAVAWLARGPEGKSFGYFRADLSVKQIHLRSVDARRMILIALSLSLGLLLLIVLVMHMLVTGPLIRLLTRLQKLESGDSNSQELTRSLHGEPLVLARKLESAFDKLSQMSKTDALTFLANRRHFEEVLEYFYHQAKRYNRRLSLMVLDIDFFKAINDTGGHPAGDEVIETFARTLENACRRTDLPARLGGDEFALLMPETNATEALELAERIRQTVSRGPVKIKSLELNLSTSIGVSDLNIAEINSPGKMLALADRALYAAKELGRNRVVLAHDLEGLSLRKAGNGSELDLLWKKVAGLDTQLKDWFVQAMADIYKVLQHRDAYIADHARKVEHYAVLMAREMELPASMIRRVQTAAIMHDIGLLAVPDSILFSPHPLNEDQWRVMRQHPLLSVQIMEGMHFLDQEIPAVRYHHERYDGKGYPEGIAGAAIPLSARILAVADSFDAMTSPRTFCEAKSSEEALEELRRSGGTQFDPTVVEAFLAVAERLGDDLMRAGDPKDASSGPGPRGGGKATKESLAETLSGSSESPRS